jgi:hypothetical protein
MVLPSLPLEEAWRVVWSAMATSPLPSRCCHPQALFGGEAQRRQLEVRAVLWSGDPQRWYGQRPARPRASSVPEQTSVCGRVFCQLEILASSKIRVQVDTGLNKPFPTTGSGTTKYVVPFEGNAASPFKFLSACLCGRHGVRVVPPRCEEEDAVVARTLVASGLRLGVGGCQCTSLQLD